MPNDHPEGPRASHLDEPTTDRFALAVHRAQEGMTEEAWWQLDPRRRSHSIYTALRAIDAEAVDTWREKWIAEARGNEAAG